MPKYRLSRVALTILISASVFMGLVLDVFLLHGTLGWSFTLSVPVSVFVLILIVHLAGLKSKIMITLFSVLAGLSCMIVTLGLYELINGRPTEFWALAYLAGVIPALALGLLCGLFISLNLHRA